MKRAKKGYTFDACHGCGQVPSHWEGRPKDKVCSNCQNTLKLATQFNTEQSNKNEIAKVGIPAQPHWLPYIRSSTSRKAGKLDVRSEFWKLAILCSTPSLEDPCFNGVQRLIPIPPGDRPDWSPHEAKDIRLMVSSVSAQFAVLYSAIMQQLNECYEDGKERGQSLLGQLASGDLSVNDFNKMTLSKGD